MGSRPVQIQNYIINEDNNMKFFSRFSNHRIVLVSALPAEPITGRQPVPGIFAKFENGECTVNDQKVIDMLLSHKNFGKTFVSEEKGDQFAKNRRNIEPEHDVTNIEYGHVGKNLNPKKHSLTEEQQRFLTDAAEKMAVPLAKEMAKTMLKEIAEENASAAKPAPEPIPAEVEAEVTVKAEAKPLKTVEKTKTPSSSGKKK